MFGRERPWWGRLGLCDEIVSTEESQNTTAKFADGDAGVNIDCEQLDALDVCKDLHHKRLSRSCETASIKNLFTQHPVPHLIVRANPTYQSLQADRVGSAPQIYDRVRNYSKHLVSHASMHVQQSQQDERREHEIGVFFFTESNRSGDIATNWRTMFIRVASAYQDKSVRGKQDV